MTTQDPHSIGTTGSPVTPGPGAIYPTVSTLVYTPEMISAIHQEHNLQAMVELQYVRIGTEIMNSALSQLDDALTVTQNALGQLATLQTLHNQIAISANTDFSKLFDFTNSTSQVISVTTVLSTTALATGPATTDTISTTTNTYNGTFPFTINSVESYIKGYQKLASTYYGKPITPYFHVEVPATTTHPAFNSTITSAGQAAYIYFRSALLSSRAGLDALIKSLSAISKPGDSTTLYNQLKTVRDHIPSAGAATFSAIKAWAIDNYGGSGGTITEAGKFQQQITNAMTAAESLNTSQTQTVQRYMFVFQQYCQSAAAVLSALNQLFDKISRGIAG